MSRFLTGGDFLAAFDWQFFHPEHDHHQIRRSALRQRGGRRNLSGSPE
jgi:hypothetical protein